MPDRVVLTDVYNWTELPDQPANPLRPFEHHSARKGETITVTDTEAARGEALGALGSEEDYNRTAIADATGAGGNAPDAQLESYNVQQLQAYLQEHPTEADRIEALELKRERPRSTVLDGIERTRRFMAAELEARRAEQEAEAERQAAEAGTPETPPAIPPA